MFIYMLLSFYLYTYKKSDWIISFILCIIFTEKSSIIYLKGAMNSDFWPFHFLHHVKPCVRPHAFLAFVFPYLFCPLYFYFIFLSFISIIFLFHSLIISLCSSFFPYFLFLFFVLHCPYFLLLLFMSFPKFFSCLCFSLASCVLLFLIFFLIFFLSFPFQMFRF